MLKDDPMDAARKREERRRFIRLAAAGTTISAIGAWWVLAPDEETKKAKQQSLSDGRPRLPPGQRVIKRLKDMGGKPGRASKTDFKLRVHGAVREERVLSFDDLLALEQVEIEADVHCVTGWRI